MQHKSYYCYLDSESERSPKKLNHFGSITFNQQSDFLGAESGKNISTYELAKKIANVDSENWLLPKGLLRQKPENPTFEPLFDGHVMVSLFDESNVEKLRIHYHLDRLNLFDVIEKKSYIIEKANEQLVIKPDLKHESIRGGTKKDDKFHKQLLISNKVYTRSLTLYQLLNIAYYKVIAGRNNSNDENAPPFKCLHFVYEFITAIAEPENKKSLLHYETWPSNLRSLDKKYAIDTGNKAFDEAKKDLKTKYKEMYVVVIII
uniref:Uncharacterized protein n=1 Tax=Meloidogyne hapla TaxID=6305 RepID=A0A1I8BG59_MELHA